MKNRQEKAEMENRRSFIKKSSLSLAALSLPTVGISACASAVPAAPFAPRKPEKALVFWYSQTGNTARTGQVIAKELERRGLTVDAGEYRNIDRDTVGRYDLVVAGSPVYYYDVPENLKNWLAALPALKEVPVAAFVTFGGDGGNVRNTACTLLECLQARGGLAVGWNAFGNMSAFAPTWSYGNVKRILKFKDKPDLASFAAMREYAATILARIRTGQPVVIDREFNLRDLIKSDPSIWLTKLLIERHTIDRDRCVACGTCLEKCPVDAIDLDTYQVDRDRCILCMGCANNCPEGAVDMVFMGKKVYGYYEFLKRNHITIAEPS
jgi:ferredoxin/flavodoxin